MTKSVTISYNESDENVLMAIFKKFNVRINSVRISEDDMVRERLNQKYVINGKWAEMNLEEREDAAHAETLNYRKEMGIEYLTDSETIYFLNESEIKLKRL